MKERFAAKVGRGGGAADPKAISHEGHRRQLADFVEAVRENRAAEGGRPRGQEGRRSDLRDLRKQPDGAGRAGVIPQDANRSIHAVGAAAGCRSAGGGTNTACTSSSPAPTTRQQSAKLKTGHSM